MLEDRQLFENIHVCDVVLIRFGFGGRGKSVLASWAQEAGAWMLLQVFEDSRTGQHGASDFFSARCWSGGAFLPPVAGAHALVLPRDLCPENES